jgi:RNA polymerase sigma factor (TIGR02999 family)
MVRKAPDITPQPTDLVHEVWLRLGGDHQPHWHNRAQFFAAAAEGMRRILIDKVRRWHAVRHGSGLEAVRLDGNPLVLAGPEGGDRLMLIHEALEEPSRLDARKSEFVKLRCFVGLTLDETTAVLEISDATAKLDWSYTRAWLMAEIRRLQNGNVQSGSIQPAEIHSKLGRRVEPATMLVILPARLRRLVSARSVQRGPRRSRTMI